MVYAIGVLALSFLAVVIFGLVTGRIAWRQQGCCAPPADRDARLRAPDVRDTDVRTGEVRADPRG